MSTALPPGLPAPKQPATLRTPPAPGGLVRPAAIVYPESDGKPMADNDLQFYWIMFLYTNLAALFEGVPDVFLSGNQNWYPVEGHPEIVQAPDVYVVFGRPRGFRGSWRQWEEADTPMTVVFEILSPGNTVREAADRHAFYEEYGVEEFYTFDPETNWLQILVRRGGALRRVWQADGFVSPRLGIRFDFSGGELVVRFPDGRPFVSPEEAERARVSAERGRQEAERARRAAESRAARLAELSLRVVRGQATPDELAELQRLAGAD